VKSKGTRKHCPDCPEQCFCGSSQQLEDNHVGGRKHVPWLWIPFCGDDHAQFHANCRRAGVDLRKQKDKLSAQIQAFKAQLVGMWMVLESMEKEVNGKRGKRSHHGGKT
jgi:hypothetical protein